MISPWNDDDEENNQVLQMGVAEKNQSQNTLSCHSTNLGQNHYLEENTPNQFFLEDYSTENNLLPGQLKKSRLAIYKNSKKKAFIPNAAIPPGSGTLGFQRPRV